jgi:DNA primase
VTPAAISTYRLGYAPPGWTAMTEHLRGAAFTDDAIAASGLTMTTAKGTLVDRFRDRIMFPVDDETDAVLGFLGRAAPGTDRARRGI